MSTVKVGTKTRVPFFISATDLSAGTSQELVAPSAGFITAGDAIAAVAIVTGGAITVSIGTTAVAGLSMTFADGATKGSKSTNVGATRGSTTRVVAAGDRIQVTPAAAFNGGGAVNGYIEISHSDNRDAALPA